MAITAAMVRDLREKTGAGILDCKKALTEVDGDFEKAVSEFDLVIERYPVGSITPEAHFKKAMSL